MNKKLLILVMIISLCLLVGGCAKKKENTSSSKNTSAIVGKYDLKSIAFGEEKYTKEKLKTDLGRQIKLEIKKDNQVVMTTTYYSNDGKQSDSEEQFVYDDKYFSDVEDTNFHIYKYSLSGKELTLQNESGDEKIIFIKK